MSDLVLDKEGVDPAVVQLAEKIKDAQGPEIEQMRGWLAGWGAPVPATDAPMDDSAHAEHGGTRPGMMSEADMSKLAEASGTDATGLFLEQMIAHHRGAVEMAQAEFSAGENPDAKQLAEEIIKTQESEIITMSELLAG